MERSETNSNQYFISMTDMLLGLLIIFLIIVAYLVISFSQSLDRARAADEAERRALKAEQTALIAVQNSQRANAAAARANIRADEAEKRANELQNILLSIDQTRIRILKQIKARLAGANFNVEIDEKTGVVRLPEAELFETAQFVLTEQGRQNILLLREALEDILPCYSSSPNLLTKLKRASTCKGFNKNYVDAFFVEGHADSNPVKANNLFKDNQELSTKRAMNAYNLLFQSEMLATLTNSNDEYIMSVSGYGSNRPLCMEKTKSCFAKNRRIDLRLVMEIPRALPEKQGN
ncbi:flagellar motor protein MotB [Alphaproteobacteria bacterium LSUCC0744]